MCLLFLFPVESDTDKKPCCEPGPSKNVKRISKASVLTYMRNKSNTEADLKQQELTLRKEALELERKRIEMQEKKDDALLQLLLKHIEK